jgi:hypothetical protein
MARALDGEPDLYPPDIEDLTPELREQRKRAIIGTFLLSFGCGLLLERLVRHDLDYFFLSVGIALVVGWLQVPRYQMFAPGAILTGFGLDELLESAVNVRFEATIGALFIAAGFFAVYVRYPSRAKWARVVAAIVGVLAVAGFGVELIGLIPGSIGLVPLALISAGAVLLFRDRLPNRVVVIALVVATVLCVSSLSSSVGDVESASSVFQDHEVVFPSPLGPDGTLHVTTTSGDVTVGVDSTRTVPLVAAKFHRDRPLDAAGGGPSLADIPGDADLDIRVPPGTSLDVTTASGSVDIAYPESDLTSGDTEIELASMGGDVDVDVAGDDESDDGYMKDADGDAKLRIHVRTADGDIELVGV